MKNSKPAPHPAQVTRLDGNTFVPAAPLVRQLPSVPISSPSVVDILPPAAHSGHARMDDNALSHAKATLLVSLAYILAAGMITAGMLLVIWLFRALGNGVAIYFYAGLIFWGVAILAALWSNRRQSLHHSSTGIAHHEIDSRERLAQHAIDTHADLLRERWTLDRHE